MFGWKLEPTPSTMGGSKVESVTESRIDLGATEPFIKGGEVLSETPLGVMEARCLGEGPTKMLPIGAKNRPAEVSSSRRYRSEGTLDERLARLGVGQGGSLQRGWVFGGVVDMPEDRLTAGSAE